MTEQRTERATLHFGLGHYPSDKNYSIGTGGKRYALVPHTTETLAEHSKANRALALIAPEHRASITHFATDVEMPADAVGIHLVTYPSSKPGSIPDLVLPFIYIPEAAKRRHFRKRTRVAAKSRLPAHLKKLGVHTVAAKDLAAVRLDATKIVTPFQAAESILFNHPDLMTLRQDIAAQVLYEHIDNVLSQDDALPQFISQNGPLTKSPYSFTVVTIDPQTGKPVDPITTDENGDPILCQDGKPLTWPQENGQNVIQQYKLSTGVIGTTDGKQQGAAFSALAAVLRSVKDDPALNGQSWSKQHGITASQRTDVPPSAAARLSRAALRADADGGFQWNVSSKTSMYGLDLDSGSLEYDESDQTLSVKVKNWANRYLGAYVQFFDETGNAINNPWNDGHDGQSKMYLEMISSGNTMCGIPIWTDYTKLSFKMPDTATKADVLLGGMGVGDEDADVDEPGTVYTGIFCFGIPAFLVAASVGTTGARKALGNLEDTDITLVIRVVEGFLGGAGVIIKALKNPKSLLSSFGEMAASIIFSRSLFWLAKWITGYATATRILEAAPIIGWTFEVLSCAAGIADMTATTVEVLSSPATYDFELARTIDLQVTVAPDPTHGVKGQDPIWPLESHHWEVVVQYKGGTSVKQVGMMAAIKPETALSVLFSGDTAISAAPGAQIQVSVNIYSETNWLCGKWASAWLAAVAPEGTTKLILNGAIIEFLVPLTAQTQYSHYQKLAYQNGNHVWQFTTTPPSGVFSGTDCPNTGNYLCRLVDMTINDLAYALAYTYQASGQGLPLDFGKEAQNGQMYAFQSISVLGHPQAGLKQPSIGFSLAPNISYDQFGPAPLFSLPSASYQPGLDDAGGKAVPAALVTAFANASGPGFGGNSDGPKTGNGSLVLPAGAQVTVVTQTAEWYIGLPGQPALYDLRRETDTIQVFRYPTPAFSPRNYYLDTRPVETKTKYYLRHVTLLDGNTNFDYTTGKSWGAFEQTQVDNIVVHPNGYVVGVDTQYHKLLILRLPESATDDADAPVALPLSGAGTREGLLKTPVALTITADGRILVLEQDNARIQAFDTMGNPVPCFTGSVAFALDPAFKTDLNNNALSIGFQQAYQRAVQPLLAPLFSLPTTLSPALDAGTLNADLKQQFADNALELSDSGPFQLLTTQGGSTWLLADQGSGLTYAIHKDLYVNLGDAELFTLAESRAAELDAGTISQSLLQAFGDNGVSLSDPDMLKVTVATAGAEWLLTDSGTNQTYDITVESNAYAYDGATLLFRVPSGLFDSVNSGDAPPKDVLDLFDANHIELSKSSRVNVVADGSHWQVIDPSSGITYDISTEPDLDVFHAASFTVEVLAVNKEWILRDRVNTLTFHIKAGDTALNVSQLISTAPLKDPVNANVHYLDIGVETKGFIYVLSYAGSGSATSDYRLDIYSPDGSWLSRTPERAGDPGVNGAKFAVDQWRNVYTLNYDSFLGPNNRTEPSVSTWIPSTPPG